MVGWPILALYSDILILVHVLKDRHCAAGAAELKKNSRRVCLFVNECSTLGDLNQESHITETSK